MKNVMKKWEEAVLPVFSRFFLKIHEKKLKIYMIFGYGTR